ncbi:MAG TPA: DUF72 domain-containing protein [Thermoplasmata archaeon]|nr:DUF72 domain-containing protein [Thermoplasmata archaeon]
MPAPIRVGCCSWTSDAWRGRIYPNGLADGERLALYARLFDTVEVDSTYYRSPARAMVEGWRRKTPDDFRFTLKFPRDLLDPKSPVDVAGIETFLTSARALREKLGPILLQFPPWFRPGRARPFLSGLLGALDPTLAYAVELRDAGWYQGETWSSLRRELTDRKVALAWSYLTYLDIPPEVTTDFVYLRFIGDHDTVPAEQHGEVRVDRARETALWAGRVRERRDDVQYTFVVFNNHYAGFAPASVNEFRTEVGLEPVDFGRFARGARRLEDSVDPDRA